MKNTKPTLEMIIKAIEADDNLGFCISCGAEAFGVEPDARNYECGECGAKGVFGAEELLMMLG